MKKKKTIISISIILFIAAATYQSVYLKKINRNIKRLVHLQKEGRKSKEHKISSRYLPAQISNVPFADQSGIVLSSKKVVIDGFKHAYNPALVKDQHSDGYILFFRNDHIPEKTPENPLVPFETYIYGVRLDSDFNPKEKPTNITQVHSLSAEDPRAFYKNGELYLLYNDLLPSPIYSRGMHVAKVDPISLKILSNTTLNFNISPLEKNWTPLVSSKQGPLELIYSIIPHIAIEADPIRGTISVDNIASTPILIHDLWPKIFGTPRGGTPAIELEDEYISFFHSSFKDEKTNWPWYIMGAYSFEKEAPHQIKRISYNPLLFRGVYDTPIANTACGAKRVIYPSGVVLGSLENGQEVFHVACGENDCAIKIVTIDKKELLKSMKEIDHSSNPDEYASIFL